MAAFPTSALPQPDFPDDDLATRIAEVSEGDLRILDRSLSKKAYRHHNRIRIDASSLRDGWVAIDQCHDNLDPVGALEIVFHPDRTRRLSIAERRRIGTAYVADSTVQLENVNAGATICLDLDSRAMHRIADGVWRLENGPYMRQFLDGYYPMLVVLDIEYPPEALRISAISPPPQEGVHSEVGPGSLHMEVAFSGRLYTRIELCAIDNPECAESRQSR